MPVVILSTSSCSWNAVPRINAGYEQTYLPGKYVWYDLFTNDLSKAAAFYHELFGWDFASYGLSGFRIKTIEMNGRPLANAVEIVGDEKRDRDGWDTSPPVMSIVQSLP